MKLLFRITPGSLVDTYQSIRRILSRYDHIIFDAMASITSSKKRPFIPASSPTEYSQKHQEVEKILQSPHVLGGLEIAFHLMEEIFRSVQVGGGIPGISTDNLLQEIAFKTKHDAIIRLNNEYRWAIEWGIPLSSYPGETSIISIDVYDRNWGECVPTYVLQYVSSAISVYKQNMNATAIALLSIATEATLRDILQTKGYSFSHGGTSVDIYEYVKADIGTDGHSYLVTFKQPMPKSPADFLVSTGGASTIEVDIRRSIVPRKPNRIDLSIIVPNCLLDHWSSNHITQLAQRRVNGLGEAFDIARNKEAFLQPKDLPVDFDSVIIQVRNNLIHLSGNALDAEISTIPDPDSPNQAITLGKFLDNPDMVHDFIISVPSFINQQYIELRQAGFLAT